MSRYSEIVILCEDRQQEVFVRHFLVSCGIHRHRIRVRPHPQGRGAAEQYVREQYPLEVREYRRRRQRLNIGIVVMIDADARSVSERFDELEDELIRVSPPGRQANERIGLFIPRRNIETWIHYLQGELVNEIDEYPKFSGNEAACRPHVAELAERRHEPLRENAPASLRTACDELPRIL